jgi:hypothetical protein
MAKDRLFESRLKEVTQLYKDLPEDKMVLAVPLIENLVFIEFQLKDLQQSITKDGFVDEYQNGNNQFGKKTSANVQSYNALVKSYNMISQRLEGMLPKQATKSKLTEMFNE